MTKSIDSLYHPLFSEDITAPSKSGKEKTVKSNVPEGYVAKIGAPFGPAMKSSQWGSRSYEELSPARDRLDRDEDSDSEVQERNSNSLIDHTQSNTAEDSYFRYSSGQFSSMPRDDELPFSSIHKTVEEADHFYQSDDASDDHSVFEAAKTENNLIDFNQKHLVTSERFQQNYPNLDSCVQRYGGLCELICNDVIINDRLGRGRIYYFWGQSTKDSINNLKKDITLEQLNTNAIINSHICDIFTSSISGIFSFFMAFAFNLFPDNIFTWTEQKNLLVRDLTDSPGDYKINKDILEAGLKRIKKGEYLKVHTFNQSIFSFNAHTTLIKKIDDDNFTFFDPNFGESRKMTLQDIALVINHSLLTLTRPNVYIYKGSDYIKRLERAGLLKSL